MCSLICSKINFWQIYFPKIYFWEIHCTGSLWCSHGFQVKFYSSNNLHLAFICSFCVLLNGQILHDKASSNFCTFQGLSSGVHCSFVFFLPQSWDSGDSFCIFLSWAIPPLLLSVTIPSLLSWLTFQDFLCRHFFLLLLSVTKAPLLLIGFSSFRSSNFGFSSSFF